MWLSNASRPSAPGRETIERRRILMTRTQAFGIFRQPASTSASPTLTYIIRTRLALPNACQPSTNHADGRCARRSFLTTERMLFAPSPNKETDGHQGADFRSDQTSAGADKPLPANFPELHQRDRRVAGIAGHVRRRARCGPRYARQVQLRTRRRRRACERKRQMGDVE